MTETLSKQQVLDSMDESMREVLLRMEALGLTPPWTLTPAEARRQPTPADGAGVLMRERGLDPADDLGILTRDITIPGPGGPIAARLYLPENNPTGLPVVVYFHGGGWVIADLDVYDSTPRALAKATGCIFVSCHYRQAPEHRFPAAHEDAFAAWQWVLAHATSFGGDAERIAVMGESAGGNMAANVSIRARDEGVRMPVAQVLVYPVAGNDMETESYQRYAEAAPLNKPFMQWFISHVFADASQTADPRINLVDADLTGLPPTEIIGAEIDPLQTEGRRLSQRMKAAGVEVEYKCYEGVAHEFFGMGLVVKDAAAAQARVATRLKKELRHGLLGTILHAIT